MLSMATLCNLERKKCRDFETLTIYDQTASVQIWCLKLQVQVKLSRSVKSGKMTLGEMAFG